MLVDVRGVSFPKIPRYLFVMHHLINDICHSKVLLSVSMKVSKLKN